MTEPILSSRRTVLFFVLGVFLAANALLAEVIGVKLFQLEAVFGLPPADFELLGEKHLSFVLSVGVLTWPFVFLATDVVNDYFGVRAVRFLTLVTTALIAFAFFALYAAIAMPPDAGWWLGSSREHGVPDMQAAFTAIFGQSMNIIVGSLTAFLVGQLIDARIFRWWKRRTGERRIWLRATGSTLVSQLVDSLVVTYVAFWLLRDWSLEKATAMALTAYVYKFSVAVLSTPLIYLAHAAIERWLGREQAAAMRAAALLDRPL
jgi:uncharacterized integral membrane protein (TIGR00697 family)